MHLMLQQDKPKFLQKKEDISKDEVTDEMRLYNLRRHHTWMNLYFKSNSTKDKNNLFLILSSVSVSSVKFKPSGGRVASWRSPSLFIING